MFGPFGIPIGGVGSMYNASITSNGMTCLNMPVYKPTKSPDHLAADSFVAPQVTDQTRRHERATRETHTCII